MFHQQLTSCIHHKYLQPCDSINFSFFFIEFHYYSYEFSFSRAQKDFLLQEASNQRKVKAIKLSSMAAKRTIEGLGAEFIDIKGGDFYLWPFQIKIWIYWEFVSRSAYIEIFTRRQPSGQYTWKMENGTQVVAKVKLAVTWLPFANYPLGSKYTVLFTDGGQHFMCAN